MKRIRDYRKLLNVTTTASLTDLKTVYRGLVKQHHPDRHLPDTEEHAAAEAQSKAIIEAYHFLVSIAPETKAAGLASYTATTNTSAVTEIVFEEGVLEVTFADGSAFEYFGVPKELYLKFVYAPVPTRFGRRHIFHQFLYRQAAKKDVVDVGA